MKRFRWLGFVAGIGLFAWILRRSDLHAVSQQVLGLQWRFLLILLFYIVIFGLDTLGWQFTLKPKAQVRIPWMRLFRARLAGEAVNYVTPAAWIGGEPVKAYLLSKRHGVPLSEGMASVVIAKTTFSLSMFLFVILGVGVTLLAHSLDPSLVKWIWVVLFFLGFLLGFFLLVQFLRPFERGTSILQRFVPAWMQSAAAKVRDWDRALADFYRTSPQAVLLSLGFHFLGWMAGVLEVFLILRFLHIPASLWTAWSVEALWVLLKSGAFLIPASLGASEGISLAVCVALGMSAVSGLALALVRRARELVWVGLGLAEFARG